MISFIQLCEFLTKKQRYSWFYFPLSAIGDAEKELVHIEHLNDDSSLCRLWYPKSKYINRPVCKESVGDELSRIRIELDKALETLDMKTVKSLQERIRQLKGIV